MEIKIRKKNIKEEIISSFSDGTVIKRFSFKHGGKSFYYYGGFVYSQTGEICPQCGNIFTGIQCSCGDDAESYDIFVLVYDQDKILYGSKAYEE